MTRESRLKSDLGAHTWHQQIQKYELPDQIITISLEPKLFFFKDNHKHTVTHTHTTDVTARKHALSHCVQLAPHDVHDSEHTNSEPLADFS